jgi:Uma2 family endonuclease
MHMATHLKRWTLDEVHSLPDDGNKYELVNGELFVTPPPTDHHETILARLTHLLGPYVSRNGLGLIYHPRAVIRVAGSEVEPDLMVRQPAPRANTDWQHVPTPLLVVEVFSDSTRRRDQVQKRHFYLDAGIAEYWMLDPNRRATVVVQADRPDCLVSDVLTWSPPGASSPLAVRLADVFGV